MSTLCHAYSYFFHLSPQATSFEQLWKEYSPLASQLKPTSSHPMLLQSFSTPPPDLPQELPPSAGASMGVKGEAELDHMRQQLHDLGQRQDQERLVGASSEVEKQRVEKEKALQEVTRLKVGAYGGVTVYTCNMPCNDELPVFDSVLIMQLICQYI